MTVGEMILKTRKSNSLTQEQYGEKFGVTRQTVSSWENEKSYPDLHTLILICDTYGMSLDQLLRDDRQIVKNIDYTAKTIKIIRILLRLLLLIGLLFGVFNLIWYRSYSKANTDFVNKMNTLDFQLKNGTYSKKINNTTYIVPNQKLPYLKFHYYLMRITVKCIPNDNTTIEISCLEDTDMLYVIPNGNQDMEFRCDVNGNLINKDKLSASQLTFYQTYKDVIQSIARESTSLYQQIYRE